MRDVQEDKIQRLPKWAQERINKLTRKIEHLESLLNEFKGEETPSPIYVEDPITRVRKYIQARHITIEHCGMRLTASTHEKGEINLLWNSNRLERVAIYPRAQLTILNQFL